MSRTKQMPNGKTASKTVSKTSVKASSDPADQHPMLHKKIVARAFNPDQLTPEERNALFVVRKPLFERIFKDIAEHPVNTLPQHWLIQGVRGSGKTTLLLKIYDELCADAEVQKRIVAVRLNEEQHGIFKLSRLWEKVLGILQDEYGKDWSGVYDEAEKHFYDKDYEDRAFEYLLRPLRERKKRLVLLVDNFGVMLDKFSKQEHQRLRELLMTCPEILIIAASASVLEHTYRYDKPFFDFFATVQLKGLKQAETIELLKNLAQYRPANERENVLRIINEQPRRVEILRTLTGGFPRTMVLLFDIFADNTGGDTMQDLERLLDQLTPFYGQRVDDLPTQQRVVVDAVALAWDAVSVKELTASTRLESKVISAQLNTLEQQGIIEKVPTSTKNYFYRLQERFFNIWYLMRNGRKDGKRSVIWFVRFLEILPEDMLNERASGLVSSIQNGQELYPRYAYLLAEGLAQSGKLPHEIQDELLSTTKQYLLQHSPSLAENLSESDYNLLLKAKKLIKQALDQGKRELLNEVNIHEAITILKDIRHQDAETLYGIGLMYCKLKKARDGMPYLQKAMQQGSFEAIQVVLIVYLLEGFFWNNKTLTKQLTKALVNAPQHEETIQEHLFWILTKHPQLPFSEIQERMSCVLQIERVYTHYYIAIWLILFRLLIYRQYHVALSLFQFPRLKESHKPIWYALMHFLRSEFPDEYLRMGDEVKTVTEELVKTIEETHAALAQIRMEE
ncbi:MAG: ATP-binding protein [Candidatus Kapabacteria bacterium]|jgi:nucleoside-triphosphatase THEP1|nr:ATP-binding protein [Candidatus Kapabacteria bacterium]